MHFSRLLRVNILNFIFYLFIYFLFIYFLNPFNLISFLFLYFIFYYYLLLSRGFEEALNTKVYINFSISMKIT